MKKLTKIFIYILHPYFATLLTLFFDSSTSKFDRANLSNAAIYYSFYTLLPLIFHLYCCNVIFEDRKNWLQRLKSLLPFSIIYFGLIFIITEQNFNIFTYFLIASFSSLLASTYRFVEEIYFDSSSE